jgi:hypothetical protein
VATQNYQKVGAKCAKSVSLSSVCDESVSQVAGDAHGGRAGSGISVEIAVFQPLGVVNPSHEKTTNCRFWCFFEYVYRYRILNTHISVRRLARFCGWYMLITIPEMLFIQSRQGKEVPFARNFLIPSLQY